MDQYDSHLQMFRRGRVVNNIFVEGLWSTKKYEDISLRNYATLPALANGFQSYSFIATPSDRTRALDIEHRLR